MKRSLVLFALAAAVALVLAPVATATAASPSPSPSGATPVLKYSIGIGEDVDGVNPFSSWSSISWESFRLGYDFLTWYDARYRPTPDFALKWDISPDGKVWTFHTRSNVKWSDGQPMTAKDVAFTYNLILRQQKSMYVNYFTNVTKVEAPDDTTVVITSSKPNATLDALYVPILPQHIWSKVPDKQLDSFANVPMVGSGPFQVAEVQKGKFTKLVRNPYYSQSFGVQPKLQEIYYNVYQTQDGMIADYKAGNLDAIVDLQAGFYHNMGAVPGSTAVAAPAIGFHELGFNCWTSAKSKGNPLLRDVRIRQAVNWAIDKPAIVQVAMDGLATVGTTLISPVNTFFHYQVPAAQQYTYDPERAKQILTDAGYIDRNGDGIREAPNGKPLRFRLTALNQYPEDQIAAGKIHSYLKAVGIATTIEQMDEQAFTNANYDNANDDMYLWSWGGDIDPGYMLSTFTTQQIQNSGDSEYSNPAYDALYVEQAGATDRNARKQIIDRMQAILYRDSPYVIMWYQVNLQAYRSDMWTGYAPAPSGGAPFWNMLRTTYINLAPKGAAASKSGGASPWIWVAIAAVVIAAAVVILVRRRPRSVEVD